MPSEMGLISSCDDINVKIAQDMQRCRQSALIRNLAAIGDDLPSTHHAYLIGSHVIVYRMRGDGVAVVRILHQRMSLGKHT